MASPVTALPDLLTQALPAFYERRLRWLPSAATGVLALALGVALADLAWRLVPVPEPAPVPADSAPRAAPERVDLAAILRARLFGEYAPPAPDAPELMEAPDTALNLTLMGVLADERDETQSRAMIATSAGDESAFAIGDDVTRGVVLQAIFPDRVILARGGRLETLRLDKDAPARAGPSSGPAVAEAPAEAPPAQQLAAIREEVMADPAKAAEYIRIQPANLGGQLKGYRVYPGRDRAIFSASGLRPGDLVTAVNGVQLNDPAQALQLLTDLSQASEVTLVVERGGQTQTISVSLY